MEYKLLGSDVQAQLKTILSNMKKKITFVLFTDSNGCETCSETYQLLKEIESLSDKITVDPKDIHLDLAEAEKYNITLTPSFVILNEAGIYQGVKFNGIPAGHEINSFLSAILEMSGQNIDFDETTLETLKSIDKKVNIKVFVTLSCPHCPGAVQTAHRLAMLNPNIEAEMIEAQTFSDLSNKYQVSGVPKIVINDQESLLGNQPVEAFLQAIAKV